MIQEARKRRADPTAHTRRPATRGVRGAGSSRFGSAVVAVVLGATLAACGETGPAEPAATPPADTSGKPAPTQAPTPGFEEIAEATGPGPTATARSAT